jgi:hypothetical protein
MYFNFLFPKKKCGMLFWKMLQEKISHSYRNILSAILYAVNSNGPPFMLKILQAMLSMRSTSERTLGWAEMTNFPFQCYAQICVHHPVEIAVASSQRFALLVK